MELFHEFYRKLLSTTGDGEGLWREQRHIDDGERLEKRKKQERRRCCVERACWCLIGGGEEQFDGDHHQNAFPLYSHPRHIIILDQVIFGPMLAPPWSEHQSAAPHGTTITPVSSIVFGKISHDPLIVIHLAFSLFFLLSPLHQNDKSFPQTYSDDH